MEPSEEPTTTDAEAALFAMVDAIMTEEYEKAREDEPSVRAISRMFGVTTRQAVWAIQRAQRNVAQFMIRAGDFGENDIITVDDVGAWAEAHLTYDQRLCITAFAVGSVVQLDWFYRRDPETGETLDPDYMI